MQYRPFGRTDLIVSELGLGCQSLGGGLFHRDDKAALALVGRAFDAGITFYDTSDHYSLGRSEELLGKAFRGRRERVIIASKVGTRYTRWARIALQARPLLRPMQRLLRPFRRPLQRARAAHRRHDFSRSYLRCSVQRSLRRLRTDYLDVLQLHKPPPAVLRDAEVLDELETLRREGKIRYYGIACDTLGDALACLDLPNIASIQIGISLLEQEALQTLLPLAARRNCAVIARNPRGYGLLTRRFDDLTAEDYARDRAAAEEMMRRARLFSFLETGERSLAQASLQFVRTLPGVSVVLPRALDGPELDEALGTLAAPPLGPPELEAIRALGEQLREPVARYSYRT